MSPWRFERYYVGVVTVSLMLILMVGPPAAAESAPLALNFQARLTNDVGAPVTTTQTIRFTLIQGGTASEAVSTGTVAYQEDASVTPDSIGAFVHVIGSGTPVGGQVLAEADFITNGIDLFVEMSLSGETLLPRTQFLSNAYAIEASRLDGLSAAEIIGVAGGNAFVNQIVRHGAQLEWLSASQVIVKPGTLGFSDGKVRRTSANLTWDFANGVGPLGLDSGSESPDAWYYLYAVPDAADDTRFTAVASLAGPPAGPAGFSVWRYVGAFRNNGSSDILRFFQLDRDRFQYASRQTEESFSGPTPVTQGPDFRNLSSFVPTTASAAVLTENHHGVDADWHAHVDGGGAAVTPSIAWNRSGSGSAGMWSAAGEHLIPTPQSPKGYWRQWRVATWRHVFVTGWVDSFID